jgi:hypothetical protein
MDIRDQSEVKAAPAFISADLLTALGNHKLGIVNFHV